MNMFVVNLKTNPMKTLLLSIAFLYTVNVDAQNVNIPDANFKAYLVGSAAINTNMDTEIQVSEANAFSGTIDCNNQSISDLTGIEAFTSITALYCHNNQLTSLDVSSNADLTELHCYSNQLTSLDVTIIFSALTELHCYSNQLTSLDVSSNTALTELQCDFNQLTNLDVSQNTALEVLDITINNLTTLNVTQNTSLTRLACSGNQITSLYVSTHTDLTVLSCASNQLTCLNIKNGNNLTFTFFNAVNNPNFTCIEVDNVAWSTANWISNVGSVSFSLDCNNFCSWAVGIEELNNTPKQLLKIVDLMGRETAYTPNTPLIYIYSDGTVERGFKLEE